MFSTVVLIILVGSGLSHLRKTVRRLTKAQMTVAAWSVQLAQLTLLICGAPLLERQRLQGIAELLDNICNFDLNRRLSYLWDITKAGDYSDFIRIFLTPHGRGRRHRLEGELKETAL